VKRISAAVARSFTDYKVDIDDSGLPDGVQLEALIG
jgi:hypothetical protein